MRRMKRPALAGASIGSLALFAACAASAPSRRPPLDESAAITVAGARCRGGACTCRGGDQPSTGSAPAEEGAIAPGQKRFEVRTGRGVDPLRVTVEGRGTLVKGTEAAESACAYVDLPPGRHRVRLHAQAKNPDAGMAPAMSISEYGEGTQTWYDTFRFECGLNEPCTKDDLHDFVTSMRQHRRGIVDPCGSVRIEKLHWSSERSPGARLEDLDLEFVLDVHAFAPRRAHGEKCQGLEPATSPSSEDEQ
jgi:hypothetical protein